MIFEAIGPYNAIGKVSMNGIRVALDAGYRVTVVAQRLDESLRDRVEWLKLYVPPRLHALKWLTARRYIEQALGSRTFDIVHAHQPQAASLSDVFQCHFLTRMAFERDCLERGFGVKSILNRMQERIVLRAEDRCYRRWNPHTTMLFDSELTRKDFFSVYARMPRQDVLVYAFPPYSLPSDAERRGARADLVGGDHTGPVIGFLGGLNERKGYRRLIQSLAGDERCFLLMGGSHCEGYDVPSMKGRFRSVGMVQDTARFYAACDVFVVPSVYEPLGLVAFEAAARGLPVIATEEVGALPHLLEYGAGAAWPEADLLAPLVCKLAADRDAYRRGGERMAEDLSEANYGKRLLRVYEDVRREKSRNVK